MSLSIQWGPYTTQMLKTAVNDGLNIHRQKFTLKTYNPDSDATIEAFNQLFNDYCQVLTSKKNLGQYFTASELKIKHPEQFSSLFNVLNTYLLGHNMVLKREGKFYKVEEKTF